MDLQILVIYFLICCGYYNVANVALLVGVLARQLQYRSTALRNHQYNIHNENTARPISFWHQT